MNKHFRATLFDDNDEDYLHNTFACYVAGIIVFIAIILNQWEWNSLTIISTTCLGITIYRLGYYLGKNISEENRE